MLYQSHKGSADTSCTILHTCIVFHSPHTSSYTCSTCINSCADLYMYMHICRITADIYNINALFYLYTCVHIVDFDMLLFPFIKNACRDSLYKLINREYTETNYIQPRWEHSNLVTMGVLPPTPQPSNHTESDIQTHSVQTLLFTCMVEFFLQTSV